MLTLTSSNLDSLPSPHGLSVNDFSPYTNKISSFLNQIHSKNQGFYSCIDDNDIIEKISEYSKKIAHKYDYIVLLGIGGSALGTLCLQQSLKHLYEHKKTKQSFPRLYVLDNIDPILIKETEDVIDYKKTLFIVVTKSGETPETIAQYLYFRDQCKKQNLEIKNHFVIITDPNKGYLRKIAKSENIPNFPIPENVGGRFSVLTACGLVTAKLIGIDIENLLEGAKKMRDVFLNNTFETNLPYQLAIIQYLLNKKGKTITVLMPYAQKLIRLADWYRQLLAESIGKAENVGLTPINALGVTDQHSQSQLYHEGPNNKLIIFIKVKNHRLDMQIPHSTGKSLEYLENVSFQELLHTEQRGTEISLTENHRPNVTIEIEEINEYVLGELFMFFEASIAFLGELFEINAFNQPGVERSKQITKKLLLQKNDI